MMIKEHLFTSPALHILILFLIASSLLFISLGNRPLGGSEGRWGEIAREMFLTHDWIVPKINGIPYRDKPVGSYWLIVLASLPKRTVTEFTTRLPSATATLVSVLLLYLIAHRFWGPKSAFLTSLIFVTTYPILRWSRTANADTLTITGMLASLYFFVKHRHHVDKGAWLYPFFLIGGVTSLMKGLLGFVLPSLGVFPYLLIRQRDIFFSRKFLKHLIFSFVLGLIVFSIPLFLDAVTTHSDMSFYLVFKENILRFFEPFDHTKPFYYYFYYIFVTLFPWSLFVPLLLWSLKKQGISSDEGTVFFTLWFLSLFTFFTLSGSKRGYYILPAVVPFSALLGNCLVRLLPETRFTRGETFFGMIPGGVAMIAGIALFLLPVTPFPERFSTYATLLRPFLPLTAIVLVLTGLSIPMFLKRKVKQGLFVHFTGTILIMGMAYWFIQPTLALTNSLVPFCQRVNKITQGHPLAVFRSADRSILYFYLKEPIPLAFIENPKSAMDSLNFHKNAFLIVNGKEELDMFPRKTLKVIVKEKRRDTKAFYLVSLSDKKPETPSDIP